MVIKGRMGNFGGNGARAQVKCEWDNGRESRWKSSVARSIELDFLLQLPDRRLRLDDASRSQGGEIIGNRHGGDRGDHGHGDHQLQESESGGGLT